MWFEVLTKNPNGKFVGRLLNRPAFLDNIEWGDTVEFEPRHVLDIDKEPIKEELKV